MINLDNEARWDPILQEWVLVAKNRTVRPVLGKSFIEKEKKTWTYRVAVSQTIFL